jgi:hypothetical protein
VKSTRDGPSSCYRSSGGLLYRELLPRIKRHISVERQPGAAREEMRRALTESASVDAGDEFSIALKSTGFSAAGSGRFAIPATAILCTLSQDQRTGHCATCSRLCSAWLL